MFLNTWWAISVVEDLLKLNSRSPNLWRVVSHHLPASPLNINVLRRTHQSSAQPFDWRCFSIDSIQFSVVAASMPPWNAGGRKAMKSFNNLLPVSASITGAIGVTDRMPPLPLASWGTCGYLAWFLTRVLTTLINPANMPRISAISCHKSLPNSPGKPGVGTGTSSAMDSVCLRVWGRPLLLLIFLHHHLGLEYYKLGQLI